MRHWTVGELDILKINLVNGAELQRMKKLLPNRSANAISKKILRAYSYRTQTDDGVTRFFEGVKRRHRKKRHICVEGLAKETSTQIISKNDTAIVSERKSNTNDKGIDANSEAVNILQNASLPVRPDIVCALSKHILSTSG